MNEQFLLPTISLLIVLFVWWAFNPDRNEGLATDTLRGALNRIERHSYEELAAHIRQSRAGGYTGKPFFTEEFGNHGHGCQTPR